MPFELQADIESKFLPYCKAQTTNALTATGLYGVFSLFR